jgi:hypothetical protein
MNNPPEFHMKGQFTQHWQEYTPQQIPWDEIDVEIILQDILCPADEPDLSIAKDMLTRIGICC